MISKEEHPWVVAAEALQLAPLPSIASFNMVTIVNDEKVKVPHVLLTIATPAGVSTVFIAREHFEAMMAQGNDIVKLWKDADSPITLATVTDMKRETEAMKDLNGKLR